MPESETSGVRPGLLRSSASALWRSFSPLGLLLGAMAFAASMTPSLIPRDFLLQGVLGGVCFAIGYGVGVLAGMIWDYLEIPPMPERLLKPIAWGAAAVAAGIVLTFLWQAVGWQNSIRVRMDMPPVESAHPLEVAVIAVGVFLVVIGLSRLVRTLFRRIARFVARFVPSRVAWLIGATLAFVIVAFLGNGVLLRSLLRSADYSFQRLDALIEPETAAPTDPMGTGSAESLIAWEDLGRAGRGFVVGGPTQQEIEAFTGRPALRPIRVYVGLNAADDHEARADLALRELVRVGAFDRSILVIATPTGTGWMDPEATDTLEYLHGGDSAIVAQQYSYLTSPLSIAVEPGRSVEAGRALFRAVYGYWSALPKDQRPRLYLYGLSLGAYGSEQSFTLLDVLADPFNGSVWTGPPFSTPDWRRLTDERNEGTPEWLPEVGDDTVVRFANQDGLAVKDAPWGPMRVVYLQYASDPITFFSFDSSFRKPDWMYAPVGPDVSTELVWYPVVTFLQLALDTAIGLAVPMGHGHLFAPEHYINAWEAVTEPPGWSPEEIERLKAYFIARRAEG